VEVLETRLAPANVDVLSFHNDLSLSGANLQETVLTHANVNPTSFGKLYSQPVDGYVYAEPLYKANLMIGGTPHNVAFVATEHDSVYALDVDTGAQLWQSQLFNAAQGITAVPYFEVSDADIVPEIGITGTPVIDGSTSTLYVITKTKEVRNSVAHYVQKLHALDITNGAEEFGGPYVIGDTVFGGPDGGFTDVTNITVSGVGDGANGGVVSFNAARENQRAALQLVNGVVYVAWASHGDARPYHGWIIGFNAQTLQPVKVFNATPNAGGVGMWQSGGAISADAQGNLYFAVGNGFAGPQGQLAFNPILGNWSESVLKLSTTGQLTVADYFTPYDWQTLDSQDADLGSGAAMLLPDSVGSAAHPHLMVELGKSGKIYLIDRSNMGHNVAPPGPDNVVQVVTAGQQGVWGSPSFFQVNPTTGIIYYHGSGDVLRSYTITNGHIDDAHVMVAPQSTFSNFPGTQPVVSANGIANPTNPTDGIVWELQVDNFGGGTPHGNQPLTGPAFLRALDATNLNTILYDSSTSAVSNRDVFGEPIKFTVPTVTNGHVLVGTAYTFSVFGLFPQATAAPAAPSNLAGVLQAGAQGPVIQLTWTNPVPNPGHDPTGIKILRSTDGANFSLLTTVFRQSTTYTDPGPFNYFQHYYYQVVATNQIGDSGPSNTINVLVPIRPPALTVAGTGASSISLSWTAVGNDHYEIQRSTDGTNFSVIATVPAFQTTYTDTGLTAGQYVYRIHAFNVSPTADSLSPVQGAWVGAVIDHSTPTLSGFTNATDLTVNGSAFVSPTEQLVRVTSAVNQAGSIFSNTRVTVGNFTNTFDVRLHEGEQPNYADGFAFVLQANSPTALGQPAEGIGYRGIGNGVAVVFSTYPHVGDPSTSSVGLALNGAAPFQRVDTLASGVLLDSQDIKQIDLGYDGTTLTVRVEDILTHLVFTTSFAVNIAQRIGSDTAYVGFTGGSGSSGYWNIEDILSWKFTSQVPAPGAPTALRETAFTSSAIDLAWNSNSFNQSGYEVQRSTDGTSFSPIATTTGTSYEDEEVIPNIGYYYRVRALGNAGNSPYSGTLRATFPSPVLNQDQDIGTLGNPTIPGSATFGTGALGTYAITASGSDIWDVADHFHYVYRPLVGDGEIVARVVSISPGGVFTKAGVMIRETLAANAKTAFMLEFPATHNPPYQPALDWRTNTGGVSAEADGPGNLPTPIWLMLVRSGISNFSGYYAMDTGGGTHGPWIQVGTTQTIVMSPDVYVGLAADGNSNVATGTSTFDNVQILPAAPQTSHLDVSVARGATNAGASVQVTVTALDPYNNVVTGYGGTVHFTSSDPLATLPPNYTFTAADNGRHTFTVMLGTLGRQTLTVTDAATPAIVGGTVVTVMTAPVASSLLVSGFPASINGGVAGSVTVTARDAMGNTLTGYRGTVLFVSSDPLAQVPGTYTFTAADNGVHTFMATLNMIGTQSITALDPTVRTAGTQSGIQVARPAPPAVTGTTVSATPTVTFGAVPRFDGTDDYIAAPNSLVVGGAITVEAWVKSANVFAPWARVVDFANGPNMDNIIFGWMANSGHLYFETYRNGQTIALVTPNVFPQNQWVHVTAVNDGNGNGFIYINGVLVVTGPQNVPATVYRNQEYIGRSNYTGDAFFSGSMEDLHIWNSARSASQIQMDMNQVTGNEPGLVLDYPLNEGGGNTAFDRTANHYDGTLTSTVVGDQPAWVADPGPGSGRVVATFTSDNPSATATNFMATITWGDNHQSAGTITPNGQGGFNVSGTNIYAQAGSYPITVVVTDQFSSMGTGHGTANVSVPAAPVVSGTTVMPTATVTFGAVPRFDGNDDYIQAPSSLVVGGAITVEAWVKSANVLASFARVIDFANGPNLDNIVLGWLSNSGQLYLESIRNGQVTMVVAPTVFPQNQWVHVAGVIDANGNGSIYINGVPAATGALIVPATVVRTQQYIGRSNYAGDAFFSGSIEDLHIWNSARSASQVQMDMNQITGNEPGLVLDYPLDEGEGNTAYDRTANHYNGTLTSTVAGDQPAWVADAGPGSGRVVASFTSAYPLATAANFTAMITWGDNHQSAGTITANGQGGFNVSGGNIYAQPGSYPITVVVTDTFNGMGTGHGTANVLAPVTHFVVTGFPSSIVAGRIGTFTITAEDDLGRTFAGYRGTVHFSSSDPQASLPDDYTFSAADNGRATFSAVLFTAGTQSITVTDTQTSSIAGTQMGIVVLPAAASGLLVNGFPSSTTAGVVQTFMVTAQDRYGNTATGYRGTVHFTSSDAQAALPADYAFTGADSGVHTFMGTLKTAGTQSITATDTANASFTATQGGVVVNPAAASSLLVTDFPSPTTAGAPGGVFVTALDAYGNVATGYTGTVHLTSSDPQAQLEGDHTFTAADAGRYAFGATLVTAGTQSLTATDTAGGSITGTQGGIVVNPAAASTFVVIASPPSITAGDTVTVTVTAMDAYGNVATGYAGTVHFTSSDPQANLPADSSLTNGTGTFSAILYTAGDQSITATDSVSSSVSGTAVVSVSPAAAMSLVVAGYPSPVQTHEFHDFTVTALDAYGNVATSYTGTVHFTSDAHGVNLPGDYMFTPADAGVHTFSARFTQTGTFYLAATDTSNPSTTGAQTGIEVVGDGPSVGSALWQGPGEDTLPALVAPEPSTPYATDALGQAVAAAAQMFASPAPPDAQPLGAAGDQVALPADAPVRVLDRVLASWDEAEGGA
jgi:hypothetical protein